MGLFRFFHRIQIHNTGISIISNNCWGGFMYKDCNLQFNTPFIGLFLFAPDYIELLRNLKENMKCELTFIDRDKSKYADELNKTYPIGVLNNSIEIHFLHYETEEDAKLKWNSRLPRINYDNLLVKFCDRDLCTPDLIREFDRMNFKNKVCFTAKPYDDCKSTVYLPENNNGECVVEEYYADKKYYNFIKEANKILKNIK